MGGADIRSAKPHRLPGRRRDATARWACSMIAASSLAMSAWQIQAQTATPNLSGNYRCEPQPMSCRSGQVFSINQSGAASESQGRQG
jgi:hypothetical protein